MPTWFCVSAAESSGLWTAEWAAWQSPSHQQPQQLWTSKFTVFLLCSFSINAINVWSVRSVSMFLSSGDFCLRCPTFVYSSTFLAGGVKILVCQMLNSTKPDWLWVITASCLLVLSQTLLAPCPFPYVSVVMLFFGLWLSVMNPGLVPTQFDQVFYRSMVMQCSIQGLMNLFATGVLVSQVEVLLLPLSSALLWVPVTVHKCILGVTFAFIAQLDSVDTDMKHEKRKRGRYGMQQRRRESNWGCCDYNHLAPGQAQS